MLEQEILDAIARAFDAQPIARKRFLDAWRETAAWPASYRQASRRLSQWLSPDDPHRFPLEAVPDLIRALGHAEFLDPLLALETRVQRERRGASHDGAAERSPARLRA